MIVTGLYHWCLAQQEDDAEPRPGADPHGHYDKGYRAGYRDCAKYVAEWIEEEEDLD